MKILCKDTYRENLAQILRRCGYHPYIDRATKKQSYIRTLQKGAYYPRFHVYVQHEQLGPVLDLHLDQKKPSYAGAAHAGEYDGPVVAEEAARIGRWLDHFRADQYTHVHDT